MAKRIISLLVITLSLTIGLLACSPASPAPLPITPVKTKYVPPASFTPEPSLTPTPTISATPTQSPIPSITPNITLTPSPTSPPKVYAFVGADDGILLGGVDIASKTWVQAQEINIAEIQKPLDIFAVVNRLGTITTLDPQPASACSGWPAAHVPQAYAIDFPLAVSQVPWTLQPRPVQWLDDEVVSVYRDQLVEWLVEQGVVNPTPFIHALVRVDLDGDGADEVIVNASNLSAGVKGTKVSAGDYSMVVVRKLRGNEVITIPLQAKIYLEAQDTPSTFYHLNNVFDLNGDGAFEIILDSLTFQLNQTAIYSLSGEEPVLALFAPCRAFDAAETVSSIPTATPIPSVTPTPLPPPLSQPTEQGKTYAITAGDYLLGGVRNGNWLGKNETAAELQPGETYRIYAGLSYVGEVTGGEPYPVEVYECSGLWGLDFEPELPPLSWWTGMAISGSWNALPRTPLVIDPNQDAFGDAIRPLLQANGVGNSELQITEAWFIDLEGDGENEVVVSANRPANYQWSYANAGDYNLVAVLRATGGGYHAVPLIQNYYPEKTDQIAPDSYRIFAILDLNGDGLMEVVIKGTHWEGIQVQAFEVLGVGAELIFGVGTSQWKGCIDMNP
jgi:hypothetical protein